MIGHLRGTVTHLTLDSAVIEVGGVGLQVRCTPATVAQLRTGTQAVLSTSLVVREDSLTLYGFATDAERDMFEQLQTASGVGPKVAQAMLAVLEPDRLRTAIVSEDHATLTTVPGIGRKGAERIIVELKDRIGATAEERATVPAAAWREQVLEALQGLGWSARDADKAVNAVAEELESGDTPDISELLRRALRRLSGT